jgi:inositol-hexakisphosphate/diphosphoinositol-pentakisphosphate 1-kinase
MPLFEKIVRQIDKAVKLNAPRTRLFFTSESHVHTLRNFLIFSEMPLVKRRPKEADNVELNYLTQIMFRVFVNKDDASDCVVDIDFSPGAQFCDPSHPDASHAMPIEPLSAMIPGVPLEQFHRLTKNGK